MSENRRSSSESLREDGHVLQVSLFPQRAHERIDVVYSNEDSSCVPSSESSGKENRQEHASSSQIPPIPGNDEPSGTLPSEPLKDNGRQEYERQSPRPSRGCCRPTPGIQESSGTVPIESFDKEYNRASRSWREPSLPVSSTSRGGNHQASRSSSKPTHFTPRYIYNLPAKEACLSVVFSPRDTQLLHCLPEIFKHPVVLLETREDLAFVLVISTLGKIPLQDFQKGQGKNPDIAKRVHKEHMPISAAPPRTQASAHYLTDELLYLGPGQSLSGNSHLKVTDKHAIPKICLDAFVCGDHKQCQLDAASWEYVLLARSWDSAWFAKRPKGCQQSDAFRSGQSSSEPPPHASTSSDASPESPRKSSDTRPSLLFCGKPSSFQSRGVDMRFLGMNWGRLPQTAPQIEGALVRMTAATDLTDRLSATE